MEWALRVYMYSMAILHVVVVAKTKCGAGKFWSTTLDQCQPCSYICEEDGGDLCRQQCPEWQPPQQAPRPKAQQTPADRCNPGEYWSGTLEKCQPCHLICSVNSVDDFCKEKCPVWQRELTTGQSKSLTTTQRYNKMETSTAASASGQDNQDWNTSGRVASYATPGQIGGGGGNPTNATRDLVIIGGVFLTISLVMVAIIVMRIRRFDVCKHDVEHQVVIEMDSIAVVDPVPLVSDRMIPSAYVGVVQETMGEAEPTSRLWNPVDLDKPPVSVTDVEDGDEEYYHCPQTTVKIREDPPQ